MMETIGGHKIEDFKKIKPEKRGVLEPFIYSGNVYHPKLKKTILVKWDKNGKCANWSVPEYFIDPTKILTPNPQKN